MPSDSSYQPNQFAVAAFYAAVAAVILAIRLLHVYAAPGAGEASDSQVFINMASLPWTDTGLWGGLRPPLVALCYKILRLHPPAIVVFQSICSFCGWGLLALALAAALKTPWLKPAAYALVMIFGLSADIILWDFMILSESLSVSLFALLAAAAVWLLQQWHPARLVALIVTGALWAFCRETNAWLLLGLAVAIGAAGLLRREHRTACLVLALCWCACFAANAISSKMSAQPVSIPATREYAAVELPPRMGQRWIFPFLNVLTRRILPDPAKVQWFADRGMPVTPALMNLSGQWGSGDHFAAYRLEGLQPFRAWLLDRGQACYFKYLAGNYRATIRSPWLNRQSLLASATGEPLPPGFVPILPPWLNACIYPPPAFPFWPWLAGLAALAGMILAGVDRRRLWLIPLGLLLLLYPHALLVWHGDAMAVERHALLLQIQLRLAFWIILLFVVDALARRRRHGAHP